MSYYGYQAPPYGQPPQQQQYGQQPYQSNQQQYQQPPPGQYQQPLPGQYQQPPQGQYQQPPPGQYQQPPYAAPPPQGQYQQPPLNNYFQQSPPTNQYPPPQPSSSGYYQQPPQELYGGPIPQQQQQQQWGSPSPAPYGQPQPAYGQQPPQHPPRGNYPPTPPSLGYGPPQIIAWDGRNDATALRKAMKGLGTDEKTLIRVLANLDPLQVAAVRDAYQKLFPKHNLVDDIKSETSGWLEKGLIALARGPLLHDVYLLHDAMDGPGTKEKVLNDILLGRSNADIAAIKSTYAQIHRGQSLEAKVRGDLSMKTERHFMMVLAGNRNEDSQPVIQAEVDRDVMDLYKATEGKLGTDELLVCDIFTHRNDAQLRAIAHTYQQKFRVKLEDVIKKEFSGHMEDALLFQLRHACDRYMHCAKLLEDAMAGMGTKDYLLVSRVVRFHWNKHDMANIRGAYQKWRGIPLPQRIKGETSGDYERLMLACIGEH